MKTKVILLHGYNKTARDMVPLKKNLELLNYEVILINLSLTVDNIDYSIDLFKKKFEDICKTLKINEKIHLIGHSTGGLIIRIFLSQIQNINHIGKCVLIATPNKGTKLADLADKISKELVIFFKILKELQTKNIENRISNMKDKVEVGAIAGNKNNLLLGKLLKEENDGRVEVNSVVYDGVTDFIVLPYNHKEIHHQFETAKLIHNYLKKGKFIYKEEKKEEEIINDEKFASIVSNPRLIEELCTILRENIPNWERQTPGGKIWWNNLAEYNGWRLQQSKLTGHCRILNPNDYRKAWGSKTSMRKAINKILIMQEYQKTNCNNKDDGESKENLLKILERLGQLKDKGIITEEEFNEKKIKILDEI